MIRSRVRARAELTAGTDQTKSRSKVFIALVAMLLLVMLISSTTAGGVAIYGFNRYNEIAESVVPPEELIAQLPSGGARIYDRNGELLYEFVDEFTGLRRPVPIEQISEWLILATISVEDPSFYENNGLNSRGLARAAIENLTPYGGDFLEGSGGSSITQQLAKNVYIPLDERAERSIDRKVLETVIALELTNSYEKDQILSWYLNSISYGGIYTGIEAASQGYFGKTAAELSLAEAALLAGIPQRPGLYYPFSYIDPTSGQLAIGSPPLIRQGQVLDLMVERRVITLTDAQEARSTSIEFKPNRFDIQAPHWVLGRVADEIRARFGERALVADGLDVITTIDMDLQREAQQVLEREIQKVTKVSNAENGAFVAMEVQTGQILVYIGSRDYFRKDIEGRNDNAVAPNSPGSTLKPFTYMTAFMQGWGTGTAIIDAPYTIIDASTGDEFSPRNPIGQFQGPITAAEALGNSLNIPAIKAIQFAGVGNSISVMKQVGHTALDNPAGYGPALTIGGGEITLLDQIISFGVLAANGVMRGQEVVITRADPGERTLEPIALLKVTNAEGETLYEYKGSSERRVVAPEFPSLVTSILSNGENQCLTYSSCNALALPDNRPSAVKTGTSEPYEDSRDIGETWTIGYTPHLVSGAWIGNSDNSPLENISSAGASTRIWKTFMVFASEHLALPSTPFDLDSGVVEREVCWPSGRLPSELCPQINRYTSLFAVSTLPRDHKDREHFEDSWWQTVPIDTRTGLLAHENTPAAFVANEVRLVFPEEERTAWEEGPKEDCDSEQEEQETACEESTSATEEVNDWDQNPEAWASENGILSLLAPRAELSDEPLPVLVTNPQPNERIQGNYTITGLAESDDFIRYVVEWGQGAVPDTWVQITTSTQRNSTGSLAVWDTAVLPNGDYTIRVLLEDATLGIRQYQVPVNINNTLNILIDNPAPVIQIHSPIAETAVDGRIKIVGTISSSQLEEFVIEVGSGFTPVDWTLIDRRTLDVQNNRLTIWDTTKHKNGIHTLRVTVRDEVFGTAQTQITVVIQNEDP